MAIVTLITDLGYRDPYLGIVKADILLRSPKAQIVDLSCDIKDNSLGDAAFILRNSLSHFPKGTIHLVAVKLIADKSELNKANEADNTRYLLTYHQEQFILSPDNGLFTLLDPAFNSPVYQLYFEDAGKHQFFLKDVFVVIAAHLLQNEEETDLAKRMKDIGILTTDYYRATPFESFLIGNVLKGKGIYVDDFGNIITNITRSQFERAAARRSFTITLPGTRVSRISNTYDEVKHGQPVVLFNTFGHLEVAINGGNAFKMLCKRSIGSKFDFNLMIEFND